MPTKISALELYLQKPNIKAALVAIRHCEGTDAIDGYGYMVGSTKANTRRFTDFRKHPNKLYPFGKGTAKNTSSAAGAYQILKATYDHLCKKYGFNDFTPKTQDLMALALFDEHMCLNQVAEGRMFQPAVMDRLANVWASLPGSKYNQPTKKIADVKGWYEANGGTYDV